MIVGPQDILVTSLGVRASGLGSASTLQVGIWLPDGTELEKLRVATTDPLLNGWRYASLDTPLLLDAGTNYILGARTFNALYRVEPLTDDYLHAAMTLVPGRFCSCTFCRARIHLPIRGCVAV